MCAIRLKICDVKFVIFVNISPLTKTLVTFVSFWSTVCKTVRPVLSVHYLSVCLSVTLVYCGQTVECIKMTLGVQVGLGHGHILWPWPHSVRWWPSSPPQRGTALLYPHFSAHICCGQMARWIKMPLGRKVCLDRSDIVLDGDQAPLPQKRGQTPQFSVHVYCGQTVAYLSYWWVLVYNNM